MLPIGPLMVEHRLIEKMVPLILKETDRAESKGDINFRFVEMALDFFRTYADRCHHGKEEDILFRELAKKKLSVNHERIMNELIEEHRTGRGIVKALAEHQEFWRGGDPKSFPEVLGRLKEIAYFYPRHIEKEDKHFFLPSMDYFSPSEKEALLREEREFDGNFVHRIYKDRLVAAKSLISAG